MIKDDTDVMVGEERNLEPEFFVLPGTFFNSIYGAYWLYYDFDDYSNKYPYPELDRDPVYGECLEVPNCVRVSACGEPCINSYLLWENEDPYGQFNAYEYHIDNSVSYLSFLEDFGMT